MEVNSNTIKICRAYKIDLDQAFYIYNLLFDKIEFSINNIEKARLIALDLVNEYGLTEKGVELGLLLKPTEVANKYSEEFDKFWEMYPNDDSSDRHVATRKLKVRKAESKELFYSLRVSHTFEEIINGLQSEIMFRKTIPDRFKYMKGTINYLQSKQFLNYSEDTIINEDAFGKEIV